MRSIEEITLEKERVEQKVKDIYAEISKIRLDCRANLKEIDRNLAVIGDYAMHISELIKEAAKSDKPINTC